MHSRCRDVAHHRDGRLGVLAIAIHTATAAPSRADRAAVARPIPLPPPVTITV